MTPSLSPMKITFHRIDAVAAAEISAWEYEPPYDIYGLCQDVGVLLNPELNYHVTRESDRVTAFLCWGSDARVPGYEYEYDTDAIDIGWGLAPDLTGQGSGVALVDAIIDFVRAQTGSSIFRATIASFNERCIKTCSNVGFTEIGNFIRADRRSKFVVMQMGKNKTTDL